MCIKNLKGIEVFRKKVALMEETLSTKIKNNKYRGKPVGKTNS